MYESHFGLTGSPFRLAPDPDFFSASRGQAEALENVRRAAASDFGVIVISGEVGAGKTTLVKAVLRELESPTVRSAFVSSTQLEPYELIVAALLAFGVRANSFARASPMSALLRFLIDLDKADQRAILVIDEAQNLRTEAFFKLATLANRRQPRAMPLQLMLVGQPELREIVAAPELSALRRAITSSSHLDPLAIEEVGGYVLHRLRKAGWNGRPSFDIDAFDEVFRWTQGIPRRINILCNRLLLAQYLESGSVVDVEAVRRTAAETWVELGKRDDPPGDDFRPSARLGLTSVAHAPSAAADPMAESERGSILCIASSCEDHVKAAALLHALADEPTLPSARLMSLDGGEAPLDWARRLQSAEALARAIRVSGLPDAADGRTSCITAALKPIFERYAPSGIVVFDGHAPAHAAAMVASAMGIPLWQADGGRQEGGPSIDGISIRARTDRLADIVFTADTEASRRVVEELKPVDRVHCVGNLLADAVALALASAATAEGRIDARTQALLDGERRGYALVALDESADLDDRKSMRELLEMLEHLSRDALLLWPMSDRLQMCLQRHRFESYFMETRIRRVLGIDYADFIKLLAGANCVLTDAGHVQDEASILRVPCITFAPKATRRSTIDIGSNTVVGRNVQSITQLLWTCSFTGGKRGRTPPGWDGSSGLSIAACLVTKTASQR